MKQIIYKLSFVLIGLVILASCEENEIPQLDPNGQVLAQLGTTSLVLGTPEEGTSEEVEVIVTNTSASERTVNLSVVDSVTTATEDQYTISNLVIPANSYTGTFTITSNFDALPEKGSTELVLNLEGVGNEDDLAISNGTLEVEFFRKCPIESEAFVGQWEGPAAWNSIFGYTSEVETKLSDDGSKLLITGLLFQWFEDPNFWDEIILESAYVEMNIDVETGQITIPEQYYVTTDYKGAISDYTIKGTGQILNACEKTMVIYPVITTEGGSVYTGPEFGGPLFETRIKLVQ